jgi:hypothetical protein
MVRPEETRFNLLRLLLISILHPTCRFRVQWDSYVLLLLCSVCLITPFVICFDIEFGKLTALGLWESIVDRYVPMT